MRGSSSFLARLRLRQGFPRVGQPLEVKGSDRPFPSGTHSPNWASENDSPPSPGVPGSTLLSADVPGGHSPLHKPRYSNGSQPLVTSLVPPAGLDEELVGQIPFPSFRGRFQLTDPRGQSSRNFRHAEPPHPFAHISI